MKPKTYNDGTGFGLREFMTPAQKAARTRETKRLANLGATDSNIVYGYDHKPYTLGDRVELSPDLDLWKQGARFGTVESMSITPNDRVHVRSDHESVKDLLSGPADYFKKA